MSIDTALQGDECPVIATVATVELVSDARTPPGDPPPPIKFPCLATKPLSLKGDIRPTPSLHTELFVALSQCKLCLIANTCHAFETLIEIKNLIYSSHTVFNFMQISANDHTL